MKRRKKGRAIEVDAGDHEMIQAELARHERQIVDLAARLVRLEAEVDIFRPFFVDEKGLK